MLRELQNTEFCANTAEYKNSEATAVKTGMGVVLTSATKTFGFPTAMATDVWVVDKVKVPFGLKCAMTAISDYDEDFNQVKAGEFTVLKKFGVGAKFAVGVDAIDITGLSDGTAVAVGTDGKWVKATASTVPSTFVYRGTYNDTYDNAGARRVLHVIERMVDAVTNA